MTVAFNFGNAGKTDSGQGKTAVVSQQQDKSTEDSSTEFNSPDFYKLLCKKRHLRSISSPAGVINERSD